LGTKVLLIEEKEISGINWPFWETRKEGMDDWHGMWLDPPSRHIKQALYVDSTALVASSCKSLLLVSYLETYFSRLEQWLHDWRIAIGASKSTVVLFAETARCFRRPRPVQLFREPICWVDTAQYLRVTLDTQLTWSVHINQVRRKAPQRLGMLGPLLNSRSGLSIRNGVLLCKQLICPMRDYACPIWRHAAHSHIQNVQVLHSKCLCIATNIHW
jgi:hypothetical protein